MEDSIYQRLLMDVEEAHERSDALKYFKLCNKLREEVETPVMDQNLYDLGEAESIRMAKKKSEIEVIVGEEDSSVESKPEPIERKGFFEEYCDIIKKEIENKRNVNGSISCIPNGFIQGMGYIAHLVHKSLGKEYKDIYQDDEKQVDVREALNTALEKLVYGLKPTSVKKTGEKGDTWDIQIGDFKEVKKDDSYELFLREARYATTVPDMRRVLEKCWRDYYGRGGEKDLQKLTALDIIRSFERRQRIAKKKTRD